MNPETAIAVIAVAVSILSVAVALVQTRRANLIANRSSAAADRAAEAAEQQTQVQRELSRRSAEPYVWVDIRPDDQKGGLLLLVVGNAGPTVATDVVIEFDPPLRDAPLPTEVAAQLGELRLNAGLASLPPGRTLSWSLGVAFAPFTIDGFPTAYAVTINAVGPFGPLEPLVYTINLDDMRNNLVSAVPGTLYGVSRAIEAMGASVKKLERYARDISRSPRSAAEPVSPQDEF